MSNGEPPRRGRPRSRVCVEAVFEVILVLRDNKNDECCDFGPIPAVYRHKGWNNSESGI
jgi:hypothetical protein